VAFALADQGAWVVGVDGGQLDDDLFYRHAGASKAIGWGGGGGGCFGGQ
jgi:hypothetical protein